MGRLLIYVMIWKNTKTMIVIVDVDILMLDG